MYLLMIAIMGASWLVGWRFRSKFEFYSQHGYKASLSGKEIAEIMLADNGIHDVKVISVEGQLTDHYNPNEKTVNLSPDVYHGRSIASAAVAAHECGHAVQHARAYSFLKFRSSMVPMLSITSKVMPFLLIGGILTINVFPALLAIGVALFAFTTLFSFITLPVEFDASKRALAWLKTKGYTTQEEQGYATDALKWAAMTYIVAALASLATLLYYLNILRGRD